ncbi:iron-sulfur cluster assembly scaffold protein [Candidatus Shapirobacteria bacterium CG09_land_8_20_14_0_10_47_13]|uniref:Iron-sulfur cluster assembly scaffold protein n=1 Tax=Candidatus Shapirobacteria bacterium CG09_land_8_20_14_0_10_47_13 TaxID=1974481 RepID=A0A2H0WNB6_9BACT|nr:MAG: iron-sulfur cluster assembly scaffold protein [Candidatus Shapirobacteria bacterium CG09_land_8_20_14_0_10_47_13]
MYSPKVLEHIKNPQNMGEIKDADGVATVGNPTCGDIMRFFIKIEKKDGQEYLKDIKFQTLGCGAAIATSSMITVLAKGKTLAEAEKISQQGLADAVGGLPPVKMHCSVLAADALKQAIENYRRKK